MKITKTQLRKIVKEEVNRILELTTDDLDMMYGDPAKSSGAGGPSQYDRMGMEQKGRYDANEGRKPQYKGDKKYMRGYEVAMAEKAV